MTTLAEELPRQIARVRDKVLPAYEELKNTPGVNVMFAITNMKHAMDEAAKASAVGDTVAMLRWCTELQGYHV